jgi:hypothetical protein
LIEALKGDETLGTRHPVCNVLFCKHTLFSNVRFVVFGGVAKWVSPIVAYDVESVVPRFLATGGVDFRPRLGQFVKASVALIRDPIRVRSVVGPLVPALTIRGLGGSCAVDFEPGRDVREGKSSGLRHDLKVRGGLISIDEGRGFIDYVELSFVDQLGNQFGCKHRNKSNGGAPFGDTPNLEGRGSVG